VDKMRCLCLACLMGLIAMSSGCSSNPGKKEAPSHPTAQPPSNPGRATLHTGSPKLGRIRVAPVELADFPIDEVTAPGKIEADRHRIAHIIMPIAGRVREVYARLGDRVEKGSFS
jgi:cobalt-zinc-cadmium efflux system membrane fusion protein